MVDLEVQLPVTEALKKSVHMIFSVNTVISLWSMITMFCSSTTRLALDSVMSNNESAYAQNNAQIARDLLECIKRFLQKIQAFKNIPTYTFGESYGAKMGAEQAAVWYKLKNVVMFKMLKGILLGSPWISPIDTVLS
ncbi:hypothetical protein KQX54_000613 [Cotesia glomerata]|uniref:Carboxypeptidase n=1 Tax=Cotesia glomerata TaxID=32391 RepID=A0AAV7IW59_COTGL|nr:hypothetical protein KQX54_000613 [Cotesia glomerata]